MTPPTAEFFFMIGYESEKLYKKYHFDATHVYYRRNSFDGEAPLGMFKKELGEIQL